MEKDEFVETIKILPGLDSELMDTLWSNEGIFSCDEIDGVTFWNRSFDLDNNLYYRKKISNYLTHRKIGSKGRQRMANTILEIITAVLCASEIPLTLEEIHTKALDYSECPKGSISWTLFTNPQLFSREDKRWEYIGAERVNSSATGQKKSFSESQKDRSSKVSDLYHTGSLQMEYQNAKKAWGERFQQFDRYALSLSIKSEDLPIFLQDSLQKMAIVEYGFMSQSRKPRQITPQSMSGEQLFDRLESIKACWRKHASVNTSLFSSKEELMSFFVCETLFLSLYGIESKTFSRYWTRSNRFYTNDTETDSLSIAEFNAIQELVSQVIQQPKTEPIPPIDPPVTTLVQPEAVSEMSADINQNKENMKWMSYRRTELFANKITGAKIEKNIKDFMSQVKVAPLGDKVIRCVLPMPTDVFDHGMKFALSMADIWAPITGIRLQADEMDYVLSSGVYPDINKFLVFIHHPDNTMFLLTNKMKIPNDIVIPMLTKIVFSGIIRGALLSEKIIKTHNVYIADPQFFLKSFSMNEPGVAKFADFFLYPGSKTNMVSTKGVSEKLPQPEVKPNAVIAAKTISENAKTVVKQTSGNISQIVKPNKILIPSLTKKQFSDDNKKKSTGGDETKEYNLYELKYKTLLLTEKPIQINIGSAEFYVDSWKDCIIKTLEYLYSKNSNLFHNIQNNSLISTDSSYMSDPVQIPDSAFYVETGLTTGASCRLIAMMVKAAGLSESGVKLIIRKSANKQLTSNKEAVKEDKLPQNETSNHSDNLISAQQDIVKPVSNKTDEKIQWDHNKLKIKLKGINSVEEVATDEQDISHETSPSRDEITYVPKIRAPVEDDRINGVNEDIKEYNLYELKKQSLLFRKPVWIKIDSEEFDVRSWRECNVKTINYLLENNPDIIFDLDKASSYITKKHDDLLVAAKIDNSEYYIETQLNANASCSLNALMINYAGLNPEQVRIRLKPSKDKRLEKQKAGIQETNKANTAVAPTAPPKPVLDSKVVEQLTSVLSARFSNGYRLNSPIEMARFRSFATVDLGEEIKLSDEELKSYIAACGTNFNGKVYTVSAQSQERIKELAEEYFTNGAQVIFFAEFYTKHENWLFEASVVSEDMFIGILHKLFPNLLFTKAYFGYLDVTVSAALESEILRVWGDDILLTYEQLAERLQYIPIDRIKYALGQNGDFIWSSVGTFSHISRIDITDEEQEAICKAAVNECNAHGYVSITALPFGEIEERNYELSINAVHNAVYRICLLDKFDKKGKIVTRKDDVFDALTIMKEYCRTIDKCSLDDLLNFEKELTGKVHYSIPMEAGNTIMVRIDKDTYVADGYVHFNADLIDEAIGLFVKEDYLPLKSFTTFGAFPDCGQPWNQFLLESYCRRFSRKFRFDVPSVNSKNAGAVIRKSCGMNYTEIMTDAVLNANILLKDSVVEQFLYERGYTGRSKTAKVGEIIDKAKAIRERKD